AVLFQLSGMSALLMRTLSGLSTQYHVVDILDALRFQVQHPLGLGMGTVGPRQGVGAIEVPLYHVEGSLLQIGVEMGVIGLLSYLGFVGLNLRRMIRVYGQAPASVEAGLALVSLGGWVLGLTTFLFLPLMQAFPLVAWLYTLLGLAGSATGLKEPVLAQRAREQA
ncbi:MAG: hypothetical protein WBR18_12130, partial [Anaerolineales bacterium]